MRGERRSREGKEKEENESGEIVGVNSSTELVGASKINYFPKIYLFYFVTFWGPIF